MRNLIPWRKKKEKEVAEWKNDTDMIFDRFFGDSFFFPMKSLTDMGLFPKMDISEGKRDITVKAELPGMDAKDIDVSIDGRRLTITGEKKKEKE